MHLPVAIRRLFYRTAHRLLRLTWLLRHPSVVGVKCLLTNQDRILLVRHTYGNRAWDLPGGGLKRGEQPLDAAQREMDEELGVASTSWTEHGVVRAIVYHRHETVYCFRAGVATPAITMHAGELSAAGWFDRAGLPSDLGPYVRAIVIGPAADPCA